MPTKATICIVAALLFASSLLFTRALEAHANHTPVIVPHSHIAVVGAGYAGLAAACELRRLGHNVTLLERNAWVGGRAHRLSLEGGGKRFTFDAGPSWYWMPEVFDDFFSRFGHRRADFYNLTRLDPAYRVVWARQGSSVAGNRSDHPPPIYTTTDVPGTWPGFLDWAADLDPSGALALHVLLAEAQRKYTSGLQWISRPMTHVAELLAWDLARSPVEMEMFGGLEAHVRKYVDEERLVTLLKWPVIFLGVSPRAAPALYSMMSYGGHARGTWYPDGGMSAPAEAMATLARRLGVDVQTNTAVTDVKVAGDRITHVCTRHDAEGGASREAAATRAGSARTGRSSVSGGGGGGGGDKDDGGARCVAVHAVVNAGDYHHFEQHVLPASLRQYTPQYWDEQVLSPSCLVFYLGFSRALPGLLHHTFFFDVSLDEHLHAAFDEHTHSAQPTFYVSATSRTDAEAVQDVGRANTHGGHRAGSQKEKAIFQDAEKRKDEEKAAAGGDAVFVLLPMSYKLNGTDTRALRDRVLAHVLQRMERALGMANLAELLEVKRDYGTHDFSRDFLSFRGNAFGHANVLTQSLILKPSIESLSPNLVFAGHLTNPGPGVPPAVISGVAAATRLHENISADEGKTPALSPLRALSYMCAALVVAHALFFAAAFGSPRTKSYLACTQLLYQHGKTYFTAAALMDTPRFLDTAAMYALFRVADDCVDTADSAQQRRASLEEFITHFWRGWDAGEGDGELHVTLPAIIESARRNSYPRDLFDRFFRSMRMDACGEANVCATLDDTMEYMEGSAAVIGEFMLPLLMPSASAAERAEAIGHARDLGLAFQLTNMLRDIGEDLDLGRQYIPVALCAKHGVVLTCDRDSTAGASTSPASASSSSAAGAAGFAALMEEMFVLADAHYRSADKGIAMLPEDVRGLIRGARLAYHRIHDKIRAARYNVVAGPRVRVPFREKMRLFLPCVTRRQCARMLGLEAYCALVYSLTRPPACLVLFGAALVAAVADDPLCSYCRFHLVFSLPALAVLAAAACRLSCSWAHTRAAAGWTLALCVVATTYATPWDNYLVYRRVWTYPEQRVVGTLGYVPIEEYAYFSLETLLCGALWLCTFPESSSLHLRAFREPHSAKGRCRRRRGAVVLLVLWVIALVFTWAGLDFDDPSTTTPAAAAAVASSSPRATHVHSTSTSTSHAGTPQHTHRTLYAGLVLVWALPVLLLQWWFGANVLLAHRRRAVATVCGAAVYLSVVDAWAIQQGIWAIAPKYSLGDLPILSLPFEEALFFVVTASMCTGGLTLAMVVTKHAQTTGSLPASLWAVHTWGILPQRPLSHTTALPHESASAQRHGAQRAKEVVLANTTDSKSTQRAEVPTTAAPSTHSSSARARPSEDASAPDNDTAATCTASTCVSFAALVLALPALVASTPAPHSLDGARRWLAAGSTALTPSPVVVFTLVQLTLLHSTIRAARPLALSALPPLLAMLAASLLFHLHASLATPALAALCALGTRAHAPRTRAAHTLLALRALPLHALVHHPKHALRVVQAVVAGPGRVSTHAIASLCGLVYPVWVATQVAYCGLWVLLALGVLGSLAGRRWREACALVLEYVCSAVLFYAHEPSTSVVLYFILFHVLRPVLSRQSSVK